MVWFLFCRVSRSRYAGASVCWVGIDGTVAGYLALADTIRPDAASAVQQLQSCGIVTAMLTGDNFGAAAAVAAAVSLQKEHVHANLLPQDKFDAVGGGVHVDICFNVSPIVCCVSDLLDHQLNKQSYVSG